MPFAFAVCQAGAEAALKREVARGRPGWRPAFARPGLVTWKGADADAGLDLGAVFARAWGVSLGPASTTAAIGALLEPLPGPLRLHVFARDAASESERQGHEDAAAAALGELHAGSRFAPGELAVEGDDVVDVVVAAGEPFLVGRHRHSAPRSPHPGGLWPVDLPADAPSRAYLKVEQALAWSGAPLRAGEQAVEIGSAPGGAALALLRRGVHVVRVDPGDMADVVLAHPGPARFTHLRTTLGDVRREALPDRVDWLLMDVNLAPQVALHGVRRLVATCRSTLRGVIFTLKLNSWDMADEVPAFLSRIEGMGLVGVRATQLPANRREICAVAMAR